MKMLSRLVVGVLCLMLTASPAFSAGFALIEQGVSNLGNAFAGGSAIAEDATTIFFNPAGLTRLEGQQAIAAIHFIKPSAKFDKDRAENVFSTPSAPAPINGSEGGDAGKLGVAPNLYYAINLDNGWAFGLGINAPFGLATEYDKTWVGRYHAVDSKVLTVNINPSAAYRINDQLSVGAGVSAQYIEAELSSMIDFGLQAAQLNAGFAPLASNPQADVFADLKADDWSYGYNLGLLYEVTKDSRLGMAYRSRIKHELEGDADFEVPSAFLAGFPAGPGVTLATIANSTFTSQGVRGDITLPASASLSYYHRYNPRWAVMADVTWTEWSTFDKLLIEFDGTLANNPSLTTENWDDSWRYSLGTTFNPNESWALRFGLAFDEEPIPDAEHRTPRIPGEDRFWTAFGFGYKFNRSASLDFGYAHLFVKDSKINKTAAPGTEDAGRGTLVGTYENSVDIASLQFTYNF
ncbi:aromatic hydrocarbon degradation protein [Desulfuromonas versatilis]|uniref:Aromatic hydrocarbon degradation protein n=1 Tax=Desulfuromonas versatilis TaxID=2802975 RepID=A0ABN6E0K1_9BACT|nr:outer membrane protein transport protein [Desulfuromonas versatilis]BCR05845.1 aromatic hydrocarbon degradation protein [Desulfuromonas versatilis]